MSRISSAILPDKLTMALGLLLFVSPWLAGFAGDNVAAWNAHIVGAVVFFIAIIEMVAFEMWEEWVTTAAGIWLLIAPFIFGFNVEVNALAVHIIFGLMAILFAVWSTSDHGSGRMTT